MSNAAANTTPNPQQLAMISQILEAYSIAFAIAEPAKRELVAALLMRLFNEGARTESELATALELEIARGFLRSDRFRCAGTHRVRDKQPAGRLVV